MAAGDSARDFEASAVTQSRRVRWEIVGVALALVAFAFTVPGLPELWGIGLAISGGGLLLFGLGLPQRTSRSLAEAHVRYLRGAWDDRQSQDARQMCSNGAEAISELVAGRRSPFGTRPRLLSSGRRQRGRYAVVTYEQLYRAEILRAIEAAIAAGATDAGTLALARQPRGIADLSDLQARLLRMVVELGKDAV